MKFNFLKVWLIYSIIIGTVAIIFFYLRSTGLLFTAMAGIFTGLILSFFTTLYFKFSGHTTEVNVSRNIKLDSPPSIVSQKVVSVLQEIGANVSVLNEKLGYVKADGKLSGSSWGQTIEVFLKKSDSKTHLKISSRPRLFTQMTDKGENISNVERISLFLERDIPTKQILPNLS